MKNYLVSSGTKFIKVIVDIAIALCAYYLAFTIRSEFYLPIFKGLLPKVRFQEVNHHWGVIAISQVLFLYFFGTYDPENRRNASGIFPPLIEATLFQTAILTAFYYFIRDFSFPRSILFVFWVLNTFFLAVWHYLFYVIFKPKRIRRVLIVGISKVAEDIIKRIEEDEWLNLKVVGIVRTDEDCDKPKRFCGYEVVGNREEIPRLVEEYNIDEVIIAPTLSWRDFLVDAVSKAENANARISVVPSAYEIMIGKVRHLQIRDIPLIEVVKHPDTLFNRAVKRTIDLLLSLILVVLTSPVMLVAALAIKLTSPGPVVLSQERVGKNGKIFRVYKFRSMIDEAESDTGAVLARRDDPRITPIGKFMRKTRIDELLQLFNVFKGDMSFIGPRPERPVFVEKFKREIPGYNERFKVKPGITGLAQINGDYHTSAENKLKYDLAYIYNQSVWLDMLILLETVKVVLTGRGT
ncbi:MAG: sugar transferase [bacterium]